ncbi:MAG: LPS export ABC transporter permease LptF [Betaproteobacteria bacterium]|nr:MAG: LPS export ABC transporter permease LptF [Betaproteobacteria bacterium]
MIFQRSLLREFAHLAIAVFTTLFLIALTTRLIRLLGQAAGGKIPSDAVIAFLGFFAINVLPVLLSLTLFISVLLTLTRVWRDSEMVIWFNSGLSLAAWTRPVLWFAAPLVLLIALLSLVVSPWAVQMAEQYRSHVDARDDLSRVDPGAFGESRSKERVFFVEGVAGDKSSVQNVFVNSTQHGRTGVMMSEKGITEIAPGGDRFLVLFGGRRYEGVPGEAAFRVMEFERYAMRIATPEGETPEATQRSLSTLALIESPSEVNRAELLWRVGIPLSALILSLLAIPLSYVNPRAGRSINLILALLIYITYSNLLSVSQARVAQGKLAFSTGWWLVHGVMLLLLAAMFVRRMSLQGLRR